MKVEGRSATTMTTSSISTSITTITNLQIQTENKTTNQNLQKTPFSKTSIKEKENEKDTVNQNPIENIKGNENTEKEVRSTEEKEDNTKAKTTKKVSIIGDTVIEYLNNWEL